MTMHGCYGIRVDGIDKLAYCGKDAQPFLLGLTIITDLAQTIKRIGYSTAMVIWTGLGRKLCMSPRHDGLIDPNSPDTIQNILSRGRAYERPDFMIDSYTCQWAYILNLDEEVFEIYKGDQTRPHSRGRWSHLRLEELPVTDESLPGFMMGATPSYRRQQAMLARKFYYPCALFEQIPLEQLQEFDPYAYLIDDTINTGNEAII